MTTTRVPGLEYDEQALAELSQRWHIRELRLFGSQARGDARPDSDVDLMASFFDGQKPDLWSFVDLIYELQAVFGKKVDLLTDQPIKNPFRRESIQQDLTAIYAA